MPEVRPGSASDLEAVAAIQAASPEASQWDPADYLAHEFLVAEVDGRVAGFLVARRLGERESEILNLAVQPEFRRKRVARALVKRWFQHAKGDIFLEVRESCAEALRFYQVIGFKPVGRREAYYTSPPDGAIVLKFHSC